MGILSKAIKEQLMAEPGTPESLWPSRITGTYVLGIEGQPIRIVAARQDWFSGLVVQLDPTKRYEDPHAWMPYDDLIPISPPAEAPANYTPQRREDLGAVMTGFKATFIGGPWDGQTKILSNPPINLHVPLPLTPPSIRLEAEPLAPSMAIRYVRYHRTTLGSKSGYREFEYRVVPE